MVPISTIWQGYKLVSCILIIPAICMLFITESRLVDVSNSLETSTKSAAKQEALKNECVIDSRIKESLQVHLMEQNAKLNEGLANFQLAANEADRKARQLIARELVIKPVDFQQYGCEAKLDYYFNRLGKRYETIDAN